MKSDFTTARRNFLGFNAASTTGLVGDSGIHIAGIVVHTRPADLHRVEAGLLRLSGVEVHAADPRGKLVVTLEAASDGMIADLLRLIPDLPGVITCTLAHQHSEDGEEQEA